MSLLVSSRLFLPPNMGESWNFPLRPPPLLPVSVYWVWHKPVKYSLKSLRDSPFSLYSPLQFNCVIVSPPALLFEFCDSPLGLTLVELGLYCHLQPSKPYILVTDCFLWKQQWTNSVLNWPWGNGSGIVWARRRDESCWRTKKDFF